MTAPAPVTRRNRLEAAFEGLLWNSRLIVLLAVVASMVVSVGVFVVATVDVLGLTVDLLRYVAHGFAADHARERTEIITRVVEVVDGYLLATIMLIFALGLYELFISRIDLAEGSEFASRLLLIRSLDDLKDRLAKVVLLILVVKYFEHALQQTFASALDLLYLAIGIVLVSAAVKLSGSAGREKPPQG